MVWIIGVHWFMSGADNDLLVLVGGGGVLMVILAGLLLLLIDWCSVVGFEAFGVSLRLKLLLDNFS